MTSLQPQLERKRKLYEDYAFYVYRTALSFTGHTQRAEDIMQDVFVKLYTLLDRDSARAATTRITTAFIKRVTINLCIDRFRTRKHTVELEEFAAHAGDAPRQYSRLLIKEIFSRLSKRLQEIAVLRFVYGYSCGEVGEMIGKSERTVERKVIKIRKTLSDLLR